MKSIYANRLLNIQTFGTIFGELNPPSYCWNDLMEATDGYCRKGEEEYRYISEMEMALQSREEQGKCNPLLEIIMDEHLKKYLGGDYTVGQVFAIVVAEAFEFSQEQIELLEDKRLGCLAVRILHNMFLGEEVDEIRAILDMPISPEEKEERIWKQCETHYILYPLSDKEIDYSRYIGTVIGGDGNFVDDEGNVYTKI